jgi:hypothetical protein
MQASSRLPEVDHQAAFRAEQASGMPLSAGGNQSIAAIVLTYNKPPSSFGILSGHSEVLGTMP